MNETPGPSPRPFTSALSEQGSSSKKSILPCVLGGCGCLALMVIVVAQFFGAIAKMGVHMGGARHTGVRADIQAIGTQLELYKSVNGFYPTSEQELEALVTEPSSEPRPKHWQQLFREVPKDPWGNNYIYLNPGRKNAKGYDLYSVGPDRKANTADDDWG